MQTGTLAPRVLHVDVCISTLDYDSVVPIETQSCSLPSSLAAWHHGSMAAWLPVGTMRLREYLVLIL